MCVGNVRMMVHAQQDSVVRRLEEKEDERMPWNVEE
jgi:hypothetical protein